MTLLIVPFWYLDWENTSVSDAVISTLTVVRRGCDTPVMAVFVYVLHESF